MKSILKKRILLSFLSGLGAAFSIQAQTAIPASGREGSASYTVGQIAYTIADGTGGTAYQGVQQPFEITVETGIEQNGINLECVIYPNPVTDYLNLKIDTPDVNMRYQLIDMQGRIIKQGKTTALETKIPVSGIIKGTYFLRITDNEKAIKTFKIIKN